MGLDEKIPPLLRGRYEGKEELGHGTQGRVLGLVELEAGGLNSKIRLINHRGYGHHSAAAIIAMIYLCCGGITLSYPREGKENHTFNEVSHRPAALA
jgi:hypothetical protein